MSIPNFFLSFFLSTSSSSSFFCTIINRVIEIGVERNQSYTHIFTSIWTKWNMEKNWKDEIVRKTPPLGWKNEARKFRWCMWLDCVCVNVCNSMRIHLIHIPRASHTWRRYKNRSSQYAEREITRDSSPINWTCLHCFGSRAVHSSWLWVCVYVHNILLRVRKFHAVVWLW